MFERLERLSSTTKIAGLAAVLVLVNPWLALLTAMVAVVTEIRQRESWEPPSWLLWFPCIASIVWWFVLNPMPFDDLNRHVLAWKLDFDYRSQYPLAEMPKQNMWLGFDWLMYQIQRVTGLTPVQVARWWPLVMFVSSYALFVSNVKKYGGTHALSILLLAVTLLVVPVSARAWLGRPEFLYVLMFGLAMRCCSRLRQVLWTVGFLALVPFYWMGWTQAAAVLLFPWSDTSCRKEWAKRIALGAGLAGIHLGFWQWYTGDYAYILDWLKRTLDNVLPTESMSLANTLMHLPGAVFFLCFVWVLSQFKREDFKKHLPYVLTLLWLALSNQVRYLAPLVMVGVPWMLSVIEPRKIKPEIQFLLVCLALSVGMKGVGEMYVKQPKFSAPADALVLSTDPFATVLYGKPGVRVDPSPAIGATPREVARWVVDGKFDCAHAKKMGVTHFVEQTLSEKSDCLELLEIQGPWRYWKIN